MRRFLLALSLVLAMAGWAWGATTYYVNQTTGSDANAGTSTGAPWKNLWYASLKATTAGDTVNLTSTTTNPFRTMIVSAANGAEGTPITWQSSSGYAYQLACQNVSHGAACPDAIRNGSGEAFTSTNVLSLCTASTTSIAQNTNATYYKSAPASTKVWKVGATNLTVVSEIIYLPPNTAYTITTSHIESAAGTQLPSLSFYEDLATDRYVRVSNVEGTADNGAGAIRITITGHALLDGTNVYISGVTGTTEANGAWTIDWIDADNFDLVGSTFANAYISGGTAAGWALIASHRLFPALANSTTWQDLSTTFVTNGGGPYKMNTNYLVTGAADGYLDNITLIPAAGTYSWSLYGGTTYMLSPLVRTPEVFTKCTSTAWTASGVEALEYVPEGTDKDTLAAGEWICDSNILYYRLAAGEAINTMHFEASVLLEPTNSRSGAAYITGAWSALKTIKTYGGNLSGFHLSTGATNFSVYDCTAKFYYALSGFVADGDSSGTFTLCDSRYNMEGYGLSSTGGTTANRCLAAYNIDDGFQVPAGKTGTMTFCIGFSNGLEEVADNSNFAGEGVGATANFYHCTSYNAYGRGISVSGDGTIKVQNCVSFATQAGATADFYHAAFTGTLTHTNNQGGGYDAGWDPGVTETVIADPLWQNASGLYSQASDFKLKVGSPCVNAGTTIAGLTADYAGTPVPIGAAPDIGAYEWVGGGGITPSLGISPGNRPPFVRRP